MLVVVAMVIVSLTPWVGVPLVCLWLGSRVEGATESVGAGFGVALGCSVVAIVALARLMLALSNAYRAMRLARGLDDNGHAVLEAVLIVTAGLTVTAFVTWFFLLAGADPMPLGINM
jgi:lysylphosphatidylglycerol synthetase-like protein (DUF2156 family)